MVTFSVKNGMATKDDEKNEVLSSFLMELLHSGTVTHIKHLQTKSFSEHSALGGFYPEIIELVDSLIEAWQGKNGKIVDGYEVPESNYGNITALDYLQYLSDEISEDRVLLGEDSELQNIMDEIAQLVDSTMYKLRFLK